MLDFARSFNIYVEAVLWRRHACGVIVQASICLLEPLQKSAQPFQNMGGGDVSCKGLLSGVYIFPSIDTPFSSSRAPLERIWASQRNGKTRELGLPSYKNRTTDSST